MGYDQAKAMVKQRLLDIEKQDDNNSIPTFMIPENLRYIVTPVPYFSFLEILKQMRAFSIAR